MQGISRTLGRTLVRGIVLVFLLLIAEIVMVYLVGQFGFTRTLETSIVHYLRVVMRAAVTVAVLVFGVLLAKKVQAISDVGASLGGTILGLTLLIALWLVHTRVDHVFYLLKASPQNQDLYRIVVFGIAILALCLLLFSLYRVAVSMLGGRRSAAGRAEGNLGRCPNCGAANRSDALYCVGCGQTLSKPETICQDCGASNPLGTLFCARCGKSLSTGVATKAPAAHQCAHCGAAIPTGARFCPACAAPAKPATEEGEDGPDTIPAE